MKSSQPISIKIIYFFFFITLIGLSLLPRLIQIGNPYFTNFHLWRQLQTLSTIEWYATHGINLLKPRTNYFGWPGHLVLEFPIFQAFAGKLSSFTGNALLTTRLLNIFIGYLTAGLVFLIGKKLFNRTIGLYAVLFFLFSPLNIIYQRSSIVDIFGTFFSTSAFFFTLLFFESKKKLPLFLLSLSALTCALVKPLFLLPIIILTGNLIYQELTQKFSKENLCKKTIPIVLSYFFISLVLFYWLHLSSTLNTTSIKTLDHLGFSALLNPTYYFWLFCRLLLEALNPFTALLFIVGAFYSFNKSAYPLGKILFFSIILYYIFFANINLPHNYYSLPLIPFFSLLAAIGLYEIEDKIFGLEKTFIFKFVTLFLAAITSIFIFFLLVLGLNAAPYSKTLSDISLNLRPLLKPQGNSVVFINSKIKTDILSHDTSKLYLKSLLKFNFKQENKLASFDTPFPIDPPVLLYALNQYGEVLLSEEFPSVEVLQKKCSEYEGQLDYLIFYSFNEEVNFKKLNPTFNKTSISSGKDDWAILNASIFCSKK